MKWLGAKFLIFLKDAKIYTKDKKQSVRSLLNQYFGWQEQELNGENCQKNIVNGIAFLADLIIGQKKQIWDQLLEFCIEDPYSESVIINATIVRAHVLQVMENKV